MLARPRRAPGTRDEVVTGPAASAGPRGDRSRGRVAGRASVEQVEIYSAKFSRLVRCGGRGPFKRIGPIRATHRGQVVNVGTAVQFGLAVQSPQIGSKTRFGCLRAKWIGGAIRAEMPRTQRKSNWGTVSH